MPRQFLNSLLVAILLLNIANLSFANNGKASMILYPTRAVLENGERVININLLNKGTATGAYRISLVDSLMNDKGSVELLEDDKASDYSLKSFTRYSPRRTKINSKVSQNIRILIRPPKGLPDGEYFGHLKVLMTSSNVEADNKEILEEETDSDSKGFNLSIKQRSAVAIPIIYRKGNLKADFHFENITFDRNTLTLNLDMIRQGTKSIMGDIVVDYIPTKGDHVQVMNRRGTPVYVNVNKRPISQTLKSETINLHALNWNSGQLRIRYVDHDENSIIYAETIHPLTP